jgi:hypothetical protein
MTNELPEIELAPEEPNTPEPAPALKKTKVREYRTLERRMIEQLQEQVDKDANDKGTAALVITPDKMMRVLAKLILDDHGGRRRLPPMILCGYITAYMGLAEWDVSRPRTKGGKRSVKAIETTTPKSSIPLDATMQEVLRIEKEAKEKAQREWAAAHPTGPDLTEAQRAEELRRSEWWERSKTEM